MTAWSIPAHKFVGTLEQEAADPKTFYQHEAGGERVRAAIDELKGLIARLETLNRGN